MTGAHSRPKMRALAPGGPSEDSAPKPPEIPEALPDAETKEANRPTFPKIFGTYVLEEMLSRGGMAEMVLAVDVDVGHGFTPSARAGALHGTGPPIG